MKAARNPKTNELLRSIPAMDELLALPWALEFSASLGRESVKKIIEESIGEIRREILGGASVPGELVPGELVPDAFSARSDTSPSARSGSTPPNMAELIGLRAKTLLNKRADGTLRRVINATGVVIHTNLGRAPLAKEALEAVEKIALSYSTLEYSLEEGRRGGRNSHIEWAICRITGAESALCVNNNAAAVLLALSALAAGREIIISSGELVEIGDSFRIPDILAFSGGKMTAVGCTNSTTIKDYADAIKGDTAVLLKVHPSNYKIEGFVKSAKREDLAALAASRGLVFMEDLGSGLLCPLELPFANSEHSVRDCLEAGSHIVTFSGDKLLGGPQIGVIAGSKTLIDKLKRHQLLRALRVDKMTLAAFEATLRLYFSGRQAEIPVIKMIEADKAALLKKARRLCALLKHAARWQAAGGQAAAARRVDSPSGDLPPGDSPPGDSPSGDSPSERSPSGDLPSGDSPAGGFEFEVVETDDTVGGGAFPCDILPGYGVRVRSETLSAEKLAAALRQASVPVISGIRDGSVILHVRALLEGDDKAIAMAFSATGRQ